MILFLIIILRYRNSWHVWQKRTIGRRKMIIRLKINEREICCIVQWIKLQSAISPFIGYQSKRYESGFDYMSNMNLITLSKNMNLIIISSSLLISILIILIGVLFYAQLTKLAFLDSQFPSHKISRSLLSHLTATSTEFWIWKDNTQAD